MRLYGCLILYQCVVDDFLDVFDVDKLESFDILLLYLLDILAVSFGKYDCVNAGAFGCQYFLFDASDREHFAPQGDFSSHGYAFFL